MGKEFLGWFGATAGLWLAACSHPVEISNEVDPSARATVLALGDEMASGQGPVLRLKLPTSYKKTSADGINTTVCLLDCSEGKPQPGLTVRLETRCGTVEYCALAIERDENDEGPRRFVLRGRKRTEYHACTAEGYRLWIDNRGGSALKLSAGPVTHDVAAGVAEAIDVPSPACPGMGEVRLNGVAIGELPIVPDNLDFQGYEASSREFLIDPTAARCYRQTTFDYTLGGSGSGPRAVAHERSRMHLLEGKVDDFLKPAPETIEAPVGVSRTELVEASCEPAPTPPAP